MTVLLNDVSLDHPDVFCALTQFQHAGHIEQGALFAALDVAGIPSNIYPKPPSDHVCLGRAVKSVAGRSDRVESIAGGWVLTMVHQDRLDLEDEENDGTDAHEVCVTAKVIKVEDATIVRITPEDSIHAPLIREEYEYHQGQFKAAEDISRWLSQTVIPWVGGVAAKARGGSYYVAKGQGLTRMRSVQDALEAVSLYTTRSFKTLDDVTKSVELPSVVQGTSVVLKPEFAGLDAIRIMLNGIIEECDKTCDDLHGVIMKGGVGKRGLQSKITQAEEMESKLVDYSKALGLDLSDMNSRLLEVKSGLGIALAQELEL